jgi:serine protein kinase
MSILDVFKNEYYHERQELLTVNEYLELCKEDPMAYATSAERMLKAIGEPEVIDTKEDPRLSRIFQNATIRRYPAFSDFYGMEEALERLVAYFRHAAQGLEERKQILYLLGPVGGGKSSIAETLKDLMELHPIYILTDENGKRCPYNESPLNLFNPNRLAENGKTWAEYLEDEYNIDRRYLRGTTGPWTLKRLSEYGGDLTKFQVAKVYPNRHTQLGIAKTEPGDENNQDISSLVGKTNLRELRNFPQHDVDAYAFSGGLCKAEQCLLEFVEMFKAPIKVLHPLLTATQEGNYMGTEGIPAIPFSGTVLAHSNESEWEKFRDNPNNEAFLDRVYIVKIPYCLRVSEEVSIYNKLISQSSLKQAPVAPGTLEMLAQFSVLSRLVEPGNSNIFSKMKVYDGENLKDTDPDSKTILEYKDDAGNDEGMSGVSTRFAYKILSQVFNFDAPMEIAANPVHLMYILEKGIDAAELKEEAKEKLLNFIKEFLQPKYKDFIGKEIQTAYLESYAEYGQNIFDRYVIYADHWIDDNEYVDPDTGARFNRSELNKELEKIEKPAGIANPKDFRQELVNFTLRYKAKNKGKNPDWRAYEKMKDVIEARMFAATEDLLPVISFTAKSSKEDAKKHADFVNRMVDNGYTERQVKLLVEWYLRVRKSD